jgi:hypothetical protein
MPGDRATGEPQEDKGRASPDEEDGHEHHGDDLPPHRFR